MFQFYGSIFARAGKSARVSSTKMVINKRPLSHHLFIQQVRHTRSTARYSSRLESVDKLKKNPNIDNLHHLGLTLVRENCYELNSKNPLQASLDDGRILWLSSKPINASHVEEVVNYTLAKQRRVHVNTGTHGNKQGKTVVSGGAHFAESLFTKEDLKTIWSLGDASMHIVSSYSKPIYPPKIDVIDAWCYSLASYDNSSRDMTFLIDYFRSLIRAVGVKNLEPNYKITGVAGPAVAKDGATQNIFTSGGEIHVTFPSTDNKRRDGARDLIENLSSKPNLTGEIERKIQSMAIECLQNERLPLVFHGRGGTGKSRLAFAVAHAFQAMTSDNQPGLFWIFDCASKEQFAQSVYALSQASQVDFDYKESVDEIWHRWLRTIRLPKIKQNNAACLVFDNVAYQKDFYVETYLAAFQETSAHLIITTRDGMRFLGNSVIPVDLNHGFTPEESLTVFEDLTDSRYQDTPPSQLEELLHVELENHPLAVYQVSKSLARNPMPIDEYMRDLRQATAEVTESEALHAVSSDYPAVYQIMLKKSVKTLPIISQIWLQTLSLLAEGVDIPWALAKTIHHKLLTAIHNKEDEQVVFNERQLERKFRTTLDTVQMEGLILIESQSSLSIHRCTTRVLQLMQSDVLLSAEQLAITLASLNEIFNSFEQNSRTKLTRCNELRPHLEAAIDASSAINITEKADSLHNLGMIMDDWGEYHQAQIYYLKALAIKEQYYGPGHIQTVGSLGNLASTMSNLGDAVGAKSLYERALAIEERHFGPEHGQTARTLGNLASTMSDLGDAVGAKSLYERALVIFEQHYGPEHGQTAMTLGNLANAMRQLGDAAGAKSLHERALVIFEQHYGPEDVETARAISNLATTMRVLGDAAGAKPLYERALAINERHFGPEHVQTAKILMNFASAMHELNDAAKAKSLLERALVIFEQHYGPEHVAIAMTLNNLANAMLQLGDAAGAKPLYERALVIFEQHHGPEHVQTAMALMGLANAMRDLGDAAGAKSLYERALAIDEQQHYGRDHIGRADILVGLANTMCDLGDAAGAKSLYERALAIDEQHYGSGHMQTAITRFYLSSTLLTLNKIEAALELAHQAKCIFDKYYPDEHPYRQNVERIIECCETQCASSASSSSTPRMGR